MKASRGEDAKPGLTIIRPKEIETRVSHGQQRERDRQDQGGGRETKKGGPGQISILGLWRGAVDVGLYRIRGNREREKNH